MTPQGPDVGENLGNGEHNEGLSPRGRVVLSVTLILVVAGASAFVVGGIMEKRANPFVHELGQFYVDLRNCGENPIGAEKDLKLWGIRDEQNCVAYVLKRSGYEVKKDIWVDPADYSKFVDVLRADYERVSEFHVNQIPELFDDYEEGSWALFYNEYGVLEHIAYIEASGMLSQDFGHYPEQDDPMSIGDTVSFLEGEHIPIDSVEIWKPTNAGVCPGQ